MLVVAVGCYFALLPSLPKSFLFLSFFLHLSFSHPIFQQNQHSPSLPHLAFTHTTTDPIATTIKIIVKTVPVPEEMAKMAAKKKQKTRGPHKSQSRRAAGPFPCGQTTWKSWERGERGRGVLGRGERGR